MAVSETSGIIKYKDSSGNLTFFYPTTLKDNVSGMEEIDTHISSTSNPHNVTAAQIGAVSSIPVTATGDGTAYTATVDGITELTVGVNFVMIPDTSSADQSVTLNVNGLGAKLLRRKVSAGSSVTASGYANDWLAAGKPVRVMYDGLFWTVDIVQAHASDLMGSVPINKGGTGATDGSSGLANLLAAGDTVLSTYQYGTSLPDAGTSGRLFFKKLSDGEGSSSSGVEIDTSYISEKMKSKVPFLKYGRKLESGTDLNSLVPASSDDDVSGTYYSPNSTTTNSLLNCPISGVGFTMDVSYSTGNDYKYIRQEIKNYSKGDWVRSYSNGTWTDWLKTVKTGSEEWSSLVRVETIKRHPSLTSTQKAAIKALIKDYLDNRTAFYYYGDQNRNAFADGSAYDSESGKWGLNCETFVQNILMGRSVSDYVGKTADTYSNTITKTAVSDFGHYFEFENRKTAYGLIRDSEATDPAKYYYGYVKPLADSYKYSYSRNSYWSQYAEDAGNVGGQNLNSFMLAGDMAFELYQKGCEISLSELEVGDILFNKHQGDDATESATFFHKMAWRNIAHVFLVYDISSDGKITLAECTSGLSAPIALRPQYGSYSDDRTRFAYLMRNTVFCARMPAAWGVAGNVPDEITAI